MNPKVTVLMSVFNGERYLKEAIDSILNQTFTDFEFLIINDSSTDKSRDIITQYDDSRIILVDNETNLGLTKSLNKGIDLTRGEYIARMDSDDISLPDRLAKQVKFMDANPDIGVCGTWIQSIGLDNEKVISFPTDPAAIHCALIFQNPLIHPSVLVNNKLLKSHNLNYNQNFLKAQDYELWTRCCQFFHLANLNEVLLQYRYHTGQITSKNRVEQQGYAELARKQLLERLGLNITKEDFNVHLKLCNHAFETNKEFVLKTKYWLERLLIANSKTQVFSKIHFSNLLGDRWYKVCEAADSLGFWAWKTYFSSPLSRWSELSWKQKLELSYIGIKKDLKDLLHHRKF